MSEYEKEFWDQVQAGEDAGLTHMEAMQVALDAYILTRLKRQMEGMIVLSQVNFENENKQP